jgi:hypothetical protein
MPATFQPAMPAEKSFWKATTHRPRKATFLGLLSAGLAIGFHDVFLSIGGYLLIVQRFHVRIGDRVQIADVTGEVVNLGLFQIELSEIDSGTGKRTGRVVFFTSSYVFISPATPLFRQLNPASAICAAAEILVHMELLPTGVKRLATNIYRAASRVQELLTDLTSVIHRNRSAYAMCELREIIAAVLEAASEASGNKGVQLVLD